MMQTNKMQIMNDMMRNLRRGDGISNLQALQQMKQIRQPQPQTMTYMAKGGFPDLSGDGQITQKDILIGRGVIEKRYGGLAGLPEIQAFGGFNPFKPFKRAAQSISKGVRNVGKGIQSGLSGIGDALGGLGGGDSGSFLKNLAIQLALTYAMGPQGFGIMSKFGTNPYARAALRFGKGYIGAGASKGIKGLTQNLTDPGKITSGALTAATGAIGDQFAADAPTTGDTLEADIDLAAGDTRPTFTPEQIADSKAALARGEPVETGLFRGIDKVGRVDDGTMLSRGLDKVVAGTKDFIAKDVPFTDLGKGPLTVSDVGKAATVAAAETEKTKQFNMARKMEQDAKGAAEAFTNRMEAEKRTAAEFARLAMEDPVLYNYVYKYADNPQTVVDIVNRMAMGVDDTQTAQMFEPARFTTASGRKPGELTAAYGGGISTIINNAIGQNKQFASGMVPDTVDSKSDGMSDSETMIITDKKGKEPKGIMKISEEEYVISAPDMAILGNGSARAGAKKLDSFRKGLRQMAYGTSTHQPRIDSNKALQSLMRG
jgi:hypothetical protein